MAIVKIQDRPTNAHGTDGEITGANEILSLFRDYTNLNKTSNSVVDRIFTDISATQPQISQTWSNNFYSQLLNTIGINQEDTKDIAFVPTDKNTRLWEYYRMANYADLDACIDEIADGCVNFNEKKRMIDIHFNTDDYLYEAATAENSTEKQEIDEERIKLEAKLYKEFFKFIAPLKLNSEFYRYVKNYIITGECAWELEIDPENPENGVLGFRFLPSHSFNFAYDNKTRKKVGLYVKVLQTQIGSSLNFDDGAAGTAWNNTGWAQTYNYNQLSCQGEIDNGDAIFLPFDELLYVNTANYSPNETIVYPLIEMARRPYNQLICVEDGIIVYRLSRSPVRLVFNVDVGTMTQTRGTQTLQQMIRKYNTQKRYDTNTGTIENNRDPHTMTESYWFLKNNSQNGTTVEELSPNVNMGELPDLLYFQKKLWNAMKVPISRFIDSSTIAYQRSQDNITPEEYRFCKFIIRQLARFAGGIKDAFITHLKLRGWWKQYDLSENDFEIHMVNPISYEIYEQSRVLKERVDMYTQIADRDEFSKSLAMKKFLNMNDAEIEENWVAMEKDMMRQKLVEAKAEKLAEIEVANWEKDLQDKADAEKQTGEDEEYTSTEDAVDDALDTEKQQGQTQQQPTQTKETQPAQQQTQQTKQEQPAQQQPQIEEPKQEPKEQETPIEQPKRLI